MSKHTKEPWSYKTDHRRSTIAELLDSKGNEIGAGDYDGIASFNLNDARRIVSCINACAGISTEILEATELGGIQKIISDKIKGEL